MPLDLPSVSSLNDMQFLPPGLNAIAGQNVGLQQQYSQGALQQQAADLQGSNLNNLFNAANNPQRLQAQALSNTGAQNANVISGVNADIASGTKDEAKEAAKQKFLAEADEDSLKQFQAKGEAMSIRGAAVGDADMEARGKRMMEAGRKELAARNSQNAAADKAQAVADTKAEASRAVAAEATARAAASDASRERIAQGRNAAIAQKANGDPKNAEAAAVHYQMIADTSPDPAEREQAAQMAKNYGAYSMALKNAQAGTKPDMTQFGITTNPVNMGIGAAGSGPVNRPPVPVSGNPPQGAGLVDQNEARRAAVDVSAAEEEYARTKDPKARAILAEQIRKERDYKAQVSAPAGRVTVYDKNGKGFTLPESQVKAAQAQGYSTTKP